MKTVGIIGCGNMGSALAAAICNRMDAGQVYLSDADTKKSVAFAVEHGCRASDTKTIAQTCDAILLAVKPQTMETVCKEIAPILATRTELPTILSIAVGIPLRRLAEFLESDDCPIFRIMPNTPALIGEGMLLYSVNSAVTPTLKLEFADLFCGAGKLDEIPENLMDAAGALSGCGPAFVCLFADALADGAVQCGVSKDKALLYAWQTLLGTAQLALQQEKTPAALKDAVCSPGGTTIRGVAALEAGAVRSHVMQAVVAAYERSLEFGK